MSVQHFYHRLAWNSPKLARGQREFLLFSPAQWVFVQTTLVCPRSFCLSVPGRLLQFWESLILASNTQKIVTLPVNTHIQTPETHGHRYTYTHTHSWSINTQREPLRWSGAASTKRSEQCCDSSSYRYPEACEWAASEKWGLWVIWLTAVYLWGWRGCTGAQNGLGQAGGRSGHIGDAGVLGLTAADVAEWCSPSGLQMLKNTGNCSESTVIDPFPSASCPLQVDRPRVLLSNQH